MILQMDFERVDFRLHQMAPELAGLKKRKLQILTEYLVDSRTWKSLMSLQILTTILQLMCQMETEQVVRMRRQCSEKLIGWRMQQKGIDQQR